MNICKFLIKNTTCLIPVAKWRRSARRSLMRSFNCDGEDRGSMFIFKIKKFLISLVPIAKYRRKWRTKLCQSSHDSIVNHQIAEEKNLWKDIKGFRILSTRHCLYIAKLIQHNLKKAGIESTIQTEYKKSAKDQHLYIVIAPVIFEELPDLYVLFQLEQLENSPWFTEKYYERLQNAQAIFDYSLKNLEFLQDKGIPISKLFYMPIGYFERNPAPCNQPYDIVFYGDPTSPRRQEFLQKLKERFNIRILSEVFGEKLEKAVREAKIVVNIHFYENALIETTRLNEALSLGCFIISESSTDLDQHPELKKLVHFSKENDIDDMISQISYWLDHEDERQKELIRIKEEAGTMPDMFEYYLMRFLLAKEVINFEQFWDIASHNIQFSGDKFCLYLPETQKRYRSFLQNNVDGFEFFPGLRGSPGWVGCGMSYKFLLRKAREMKLPTVTICEDDVNFLPKWESRLDSIKKYLSGCNREWHIFAGFIVELHEDTDILDIKEHDDLTMVHINRMTSMVFNTYHERFYDVLDSWDETDHRMHLNTIDRYIEGMGTLEIVTTTPFIVSHKRELDSVLWDVKSFELYDEKEEKTDLLFKEKINHFLAK